MARSATRTHDPGRAPRPKGRVTPYRTSGALDLRRGRVRCLATSRGHGVCLRPSSCRGQAFGYRTVPCGFRETDEHRGVSKQFSPHPPQRTTSAESMSVEANPGPNAEDVMSNIITKAIFTVTAAVLMLASAPGNATHVEKKIGQFYGRPRSVTENVSPPANHPKRR